MDNWKIALCLTAIIVFAVLVETVIIPAWHRPSDLGDVFPSDPVLGELFYRDDWDKLCIFNGSSWLNLTKEALLYSIDAITNPEQSPVFILYTESNLTKWKNCSSGDIIETSSNHTKIMKHALGNLTIGRDWQEKIVFKGNFTIGKIIIPDYTIVEIHGSVKAKDNLNDAMFQIIDGQYITLIGGLINGNKDGQSAKASLLDFSGNHIKIMNMRSILAYDTSISISGFNFLIHNNYIDAFSYGIKVNSDSRFGAITSNYIYSCDYAGVKVFNGSYDFSIIDNKFYKNEYSVHLYGYPNAVTNFDITHNIMANSPTGGGIKIENGQRGSISSNPIHNNFAEGIYIPDGNYLEINNNIVYSNLQTGIYVGQPASVSTNIQISGNHVIDNDADNDGQNGIHLLKVRDSAITKNLVHGATQDFGIYESTACDNNTITDNVVSGNEQPISIYGDNTIVERNIGFVTQNSFLISDCVNGTLWPHGLAGTPNIVIFTIEGSIYVNDTCHLINPTIINSDNTNIEIGFYKDDNGAISPVTATNQRNVYCYVEYHP